MKGRGKGKISCFLVMLLVLMSLCGCEKKYGDFYIQEAPYESRQFIENWLAYKAQMEDTTKFTNQPELAQEQANLENETKQTDAVETKKEPYVKQESQVEIENAVVQSLFEHGFYYQYLSDSLKVVYDEMLESMLQMEKVKISN